jgi:N-acetylmuramoyl-L-alanine amidase
MNFYDAWSDLELLAYVMWAEARGEQQEGMRAVGHVIHNRVKNPGFPVTIRAVLTQENAFSCLLPNDPEYGKEPGDDDIQYEFCLHVAPAIMGGLDIDPTNGAHFYMNSATATSPWFLHHIVGDQINHPLTATIGHQNFYK